MSSAPAENEVLRRTFFLVEIHGIPGFGSDYSFQNTQTRNKTLRGPLWRLCGTGKEEVSMGSWSSCSYHTTPYQTTWSQNLVWIVLGLNHMRSESQKMRSCSLALFNPAKAIPWLSLWELIQVLNLFLMGIHPNKWKNEGKQRWFLGYPWLTWETSITIWLQDWVFGESGR